MEKINDGGPAFPIGSTPDEWGNGMSLRDKFADSALPSVVAYGYTLGYMSADKMAEECYMIADAMLKAREVKS